MIKRSGKPQTLSLAEWPTDVQQRAQHWVKVYKKIRHLLVKDYYRLLPQPKSRADWDAGQFCDGWREGVVFVFRVDGSDDKQSLFLRGLNADTNYRFRDEYDGAEQVISARKLNRKGFKVELRPNSGKLYSYREENP